MVISYNWLKTLINFDLTIDEVSELLTDTGLEVEKVHKIETIKGGLHGLIVGEVLECGPAENSDKLKSTIVDLGDRQVPIVCGAPNVAKGQKVVVAPVGTEIHPTNGESFKIKKAKIRGNLSEGMICAEDEIGLGSDHGGIMVLDGNLAVGTPIRSLYNIEDDYQIEIGLTPNRGDAASHMGTARDIKAMDKGELIAPELAALPDNLPACMPIEIQDKEACPRYTAIVLENITVKDSPKWLQDRLRAINLKPINNVVDTTNFVLHELGQPIHAFDADQIDSGIVVRMSNTSDKIITLDETERELTGNELLICDHSKPLAIAGVFGGLRSGVSANTKRVLIESAYFNPATIRKSAKTQGLSTDASFRYERGCDPNITIAALRRVVAILQEVAGAQVASTLTDNYPSAIDNQAITFGLDWLNQFCGASLSAEKVSQILTGLDIEVVKQNGDEFEVSVPPYRSDVTRPVDIAEEILRIYGYNNIEIPSRLSMTPATADDFDRLEVKNKVTNFLINKGFYETMSNSQTAPKESDKDTGVMLLNPLGAEQSMMRTDMYDGLLSSVAYNLNRKQSDVLFFEFGKTYLTKNEKYIEQNNLSFATTGSSSKKNWATNSPEADFFFLKGLITQLAQTLGIPHKKMLKATHLEVLSGERLKPYGIKKNISFATVNWDQVLNLVKSSKFNLKDIPKFPIVTRDLSIIINEGTTFNEIEKIVVKVAGKYHRSVEVFDVYEGKNLEKGSKSYAINVELYDSTQTMTDKRIDGIMDKMIQRLEAELSCTIRR